MRIPRLTRRGIARLSAVLALLGCESSMATEIPANARALEVSEFPATVTTLLYNTASSARQRIVIREQAEWEELWTNATRNYQPPPEIPPVNFSSEMVVIAGMGSRPTGGFSIGIESAHEADGTLFITVLESSPGPRCFTTQAFTSPLTAARVPRRDGPTTFVEKTEINNC
jgi:hypothetical protein